MSMEDKINRAVGGTIVTAQSLALLGMMGLVFYNIIARNFFNSSLISIFEITGFLMVFLIFLGAPRGLILNTEIRVDFLAHFLPDGARKVLWVVQKIVILVISLTVAWFFAVHVSGGFGRRGTPILQFQHIYYFSPVFFAFAGAALVTVWHLIKFSRGKITHDWF